jgi:hypothetical protein
MTPPAWATRKHQAAAAAIPEQQSDVALSGKAAVEAGWATQTYGLVTDSEHPNAKERQGEEPLASQQAAWPLQEP